MDNIISNGFPVVTEHNWYDCGVDYYGFLTDKAYKIRLFVLYDYVGKFIFT